jgi:UDP-GlcNAc:undecaprenyl-phosphate/decaprenyl-phosphate GlcNAc-1-phosphate transferase
VQALPFALSLVTAALTAPALLRRLQEGGHTRENYRGAPLPCPFGVLIGAAAAIALIPVSLWSQYIDAADVPVVGLPLVAGVAFLGLLDDAIAGASRGWRGHGAATLRGDLSTGALKAVGTLGLALFFALGLSAAEDRPGEDFLLIALVVTLATNVSNLLDLRPGRAVKAFVLLGIGLVLGEGSLDMAEALGIWIGPILVAGAFDLRERAMLGDSGSNVIGVVAGAWLALALDTTGLAVAAAILALVTAYGEFRSINALVERTPGLRHLDSFGRVHRA